MRPLSSPELDRMIVATTRSFPDLCTVDTLSVTRNSYGEEVSVYTPGAQISCGFELVGGAEAPKDELVVTVTRAFFSLPIDTVITLKDRITLQKRYNKTVSYQFDVVSEPVKNLDCVRVECVFVGV